MIIPTSKFPVSILCVDDEPVNMDIVTRHLSSLVDSIIFARNGREGHTLFLEKRPDIVLTDYIMPECNGLEMSRMIRTIDPRIPIILLTSCNSVDFLAEAIDVGITQFLPKPILKAKLLTALQRCYETIDLERCLKREHELAEEHLLRSQKLESLGVLAGGIAHNFNNILTAIIGNTSLAMMRLPDDSPATKFLKSIEASATRAAEIAKQMLDYSGNGFMRVSLINLNELLGNMQSALEMAVPNTISKRFIPLASSFSTKGDAGQLRQVVMSLVINAVEAIGDSNGTIGITSGSAAFDRAYFDSCCFENTNSEGIYVYLDVSDTGCGMDKETIDKLFDPFFSTKFTGRGLGMAAVLGIVRWHKGAIHIESAPGAGSTFRILLPVSTETGAILTGGEHA